MLRLKSGALRFVGLVRRLNTDWIGTVFGSKPGTDASTWMSPVRGSSATTEPLRPPSCCSATRWAAGFSVVRTSSPSRFVPLSWSKSEPSSPFLPVSALLRYFSRPARPIDV